MKGPRMADLYALAGNYAVDVYNDYTEDDARHLPPSIQMVWEIGRKIEQRENEEMAIHKVFCYECKAFKDFEAAGDLGQYGGDTFGCPCGKETVVPKQMSRWADGCPKYALFHVASLEPPADLEHCMKSAMPKTSGKP